MLPSNHPILPKTTPKPQPAPDSVPSINHLPFQPPNLQNEPICHHAVILQNKPNSGVDVHVDISSVGTPTEDYPPFCKSNPIVTHPSFCKSNPSPVGAIADRNDSTPNNPFCKTNPPPGNPERLLGPFTPLPSPPILQNEPNRHPTFILQNKPNLPSWSSGLPGIVKQTHPTPPTSNFQIS